MNLNKVPINTKAIVKSLNCNGDIRRRLLDLGIVKNTFITPIFKSPFGEPTAYEVRGTIISFREEDSCLIDIEIIN